MPPEYRHYDRRAYLQQLQSAHPDHIIGNLLEMLPIVEAHLSAAQK